MKRTAPSRPFSVALGRSPLAATGVRGCSLAVASFAALSPFVALLSRGSGTQFVYRGSFWDSASVFSGMRTVRKRSAGKWGPTVVCPRLWVYNSRRSKRVSFDWVSLESFSAGKAARSYPLLPHDSSSSSRSQRLAPRPRFAGQVTALPVPNR